MDTPISRTHSQITQYAIQHNLDMRDAMADLLRKNIWPERFVRNYPLLSAEQQIRLLYLPIVIAGCGGLGGEIAAMLVRMGAGNIHLYDPDHFEESNLNRQRFCTEATLGKDKSAVTAAELKNIASFGTYTPYNIRLTEENLPGILAHCEIVFDCLDSVECKAMLEHAALVARIALVHGSVLYHEGFATLSSPAAATLENIYGADTSLKGAGPVLAPVPVGTAALMCALFIKWLGRSTSSPSLYHLDYSVPELEKFQLP